MLRNALKGKPGPSSGDNVTRTEKGNARDAPYVNTTWGALCVG